MDLAESGMSDREISAVGYVVMKVWGAKVFQKNRSVPNLVKAP
jgi:hypothetical protein